MCKIVTCADGKKYKKIDQSICGYKEHIDRDGNLIREKYALPIKIVPFEKTVIIEGELYEEL